MYLFAKKNFGADIKAIWYGFTVSLGIWFTAAIIGLFWLYLKGEGAYWLTIYLYLTGVLGVFAGGIFAGLRSRERGWQNGLWAGLLLGLFGIIAGLEIAPHLYNWAGIGRQLLVWSLWGLVGGYLGFARLRSKDPKKRQAKKQMPG